MLNGMLLNDRSELQVIVFSHHSPFEFSHIWPQLYQVISEPIYKASFHTIALEFSKKNGIVQRIECFRKVRVQNVSSIVIIKLLSY